MLLGLAPYPAVKLIANPLAALMSLGYVPPSLKTIFAGSENVST